MFFVSTPCRSNQVSQPNVCSCRFHLWNLEAPVGRRNERPAINAGASVDTTVHRDAFVCGPLDVIARASHVSWGRTQSWLDRRR